jgi:hypothetical protein
LLFVFAESHSFVSLSLVNTSEFEASCEFSRVL